MREDKFAKSEGLPGNYFEGKNGLSYRFTILKDIAEAGPNPSIAYDDSQEESIFGLYGKYKDFALYVHFPWCVEHCSYCHYYRGPMLKRGELETMLKAERKHAQMFDERIDLPSRHVPSIYFGGGTPTVLPPDLLEESVGYYVEHYRRSEDCEVCLEASIITLKTMKKIEILERYINRLSIGVQSFDDNILKLIERKHTGAQAKETLKELVPRFASVNADLIYGLCDQDLSTWLATIETTIQLHVPSLTIYRLDIRDVPAISQTFRKEPGRFPDEYQCWQMYTEAKKMLLAAGYRENLVGWFLLPQVKDTTVYRERWEKQSPCISFGPRLHNYAADHFYESLEKHGDYIAALEAGKLPIRSINPLSPQKQLVWYVLAQWKSNSPVIQSVIIQRFGENLHDWFMKLIRHYLAWGVLDQSGDNIKVNEAYHYILEWILLELIEALK